MTDQQAIHDGTVERLTGQLRAALARAGRYTVLSRVRWRPTQDFPNIVHQSDVLVVPVDAAVIVNGDEVRFQPRDVPTTVIEVLSPEDFEADFYDKPDELVGTGV